MKLKRIQQSASLFIVAILFLLLNSCEKEQKDPALETTSITAISASNYHVTAKVTEKGDFKILDYGFVYSIGTTAENGYTYNKISLGKSIEQDTFSTMINIGSIQYYLSNELKVFAKGYITNERGTMYAKVVSTELLILQVTQVTPGLAKAGDTVTLNGKGFSMPVSENIVKFNNVSATVISVTPYQIRVIVPAGIPYSYWGNTITLTVNSGGQTFQLENALKMSASPVSFSPASGNWHTYITIQGSNLYNSVLYFDDVQIGTNTYSNESISATIPNSFLKKKFKIYVSTDGVKTEVPGGYFTMDKFVVSPLTSLKYIPGSVITFTSNGFNPIVNNNKLFLGSTSIISTNSYSYSDLLFTIPASMPEGNYPVMLSNGADTALTGQVISLVKPTVTGFTPSSGYPGSELEINGTNLLAHNQSLYVYYTNSGYVSVSPNSVTSDKIKVNVPWLPGGQYYVYVYMGDLVLQCPEKFTVLEPKVISINPSTGTAGASVIINGEGFATNVIAVQFGNLYATVMSSTNSQINVKVPSGISSGKWLVKVIVNYSYELSTSVTFTVP